MKTKVTPWEVSGDIDYKKLIKQFGLEPMKQLPEIFDKNILFRRKIIFANRDIGKILTAIKDSKPFVVMTGLMPTGEMHIGHMILIQQLVFWQSLGAKIYIAVADIEAYNARGQSLEESRKKAEDYIKNYIAIGLKPKNCEIYFQSERSTDAKKSNAYYRLQNLFANHASFNEFKGVYGEISPGKMTASLLQASDMFHSQLPEFEGNTPVLIPVGVDQDPHIRLARGISKRFKSQKFNQISSTYHTFMPGLKSGKMSASDPNSHIALTDTSNQIKNKINKHAFSGGKETVEEHRKRGGNIETDVACQWLKYFEESDEKLEQIYKQYSEGKLLSGEVKKILIEKLQKILSEHQEKRKSADLSKFIYKTK
ncbi:tryptophan--tRNA ligase [Methanococcoides sp. SA1]|nr:tryptophan--tRNA ligase [Methanococcoides sp. SA1]